MTPRDERRDFRQRLMKKLTMSAMEPAMQLKRQQAQAMKVELARQYTCRCGGPTFAAGQPCDRCSELRDEARMKAAGMKGTA